MSSPFSLPSSLFSASLSLGAAGVSGVPGAAAVSFVGSRRFAAAGTLRRLALFAGLGAVVVASPLSLGGGGVLVVVAPSLSACLASPVVGSSRAAGALVFVRPGRVLRRLPASCMLRRGGASC